MRRAAALRLQPMLGARAVGEAAVQADQRRVRKTLAERLLQPRRQADLRHQQQRLLARRQGARDQAQVDLGLAAAGNAMQQKDAVTGTGALYFSEHALLLVIERGLFDEAAGPGAGRGMIALYPSRIAEFGEGFFRTRALCQQQRLGAIGPRQRLQQRALHFFPSGQVCHRQASAARETVSAVLLEGERCARFAQAHRQPGKNNFAQRPVIIAAAEFHEVQPVAPERRGLAQDAHCGFQLRAFDFRGVGNADDHADRLLVAERHQHAHADVGDSRFVATVIEQARQRQIERDAQNAHSLPVQEIG